MIICHDRTTLPINATGMMIPIDAASRPPRTTDQHHFLLGSSGDRRSHFAHLLVRFSARRQVATEECTSGKMVEATPSEIQGGVVGGEVQLSVEGAAWLRVQLSSINVQLSSPSGRMCNYMCNYMRNCQAQVGAIPTFPQYMTQTSRV